MDAPPFSNSAYGQYDLNAHYARLAILFCAVVLSTNVALRKQRLRWLAAKDPQMGEHRRLEQDGSGEKWDA